jgi:hypothetical protein
MKVNHLKKKKKIVLYHFINKIGVHVFIDQEKLDLNPLTRLKPKDKNGYV